MAYHQHHASLAAATAKKIFEAGNNCRISEPLAIDVTLEALPAKFARRRQSNSIAHRLLAAKKPRIEQAATLPNGAEHMIVRDDCVVEIDADA
jgi:hypothetical protein